RDAVHIVAVSDNQQVSGFHIAHHRLQLHGADDELVEGLVKPGPSPQHVTVHDVDHFGKGEPLDVGTPFSLDADRSHRATVLTNPWFSASLIARYAVPSLTPSSRAMVRTEIFSPTSSCSIYRRIRSCLVGIRIPSFLSAIKLCYNTLYT